MVGLQRILVPLTAAVAAVATLLISVLPFAEFAYRSVPMHVAIETAATLIAALAALLVMGRFRRSGHLSDLLLTGAMVVLALTNLFFSAIPSLAGEPGDFEIWSPVGGRTLGALALALAAFAPPRRIPRPSRALAQLTAACVAAVVLIGVLAAVVGPHIPAGIDPDLSPEASGRPRIVGSPGLLALQLAVMFVFFGAAAGFARRARGGDELMLWFAAASVLGGFARLNYFLFPSLYSEWVYTGDAMRLGFYLLIFTGAAREIVSYQRELAATAALRERRRIARDLHDGVAQHLAFISSQAQLLPRVSDQEPLLAQIAEAAVRALDESRNAIVALTGPEDEPVETALSRAAEEVALRGGARVRFELAPEVHAPPEAREALVRIVQEAITNATRHGGAENVTVSLANANGILLRVRDDGRGFDAEEGPRPGGFGLVSMRERAESLGGRFRIAATPGGGTEVEVRLP
jgi:signal transduction histidine kinase